MRHLVTVHERHRPVVLGSAATAFAATLSVGLLWQSLAGRPAGRDAPVVVSVVEPTATRPFPSFEPRQTSTPTTSARVVIGVPPFVRLEGRP